SIKQGIQMVQIRRGQPLWSAMMCAQPRAAGRGKITLSSEYGRHAPVQRNPSSMTNISELMPWWTPPAPKPISRLFRLSQTAPTNATGGQEPEHQPKSRGEHPEDEKRADNGRSAQDDRHHYTRVRLEGIGSCETTDHFLKAVRGGDATEQVAGAHIGEKPRRRRREQGRPTVAER